MDYLLRIQKQLFVRVGVIQLLHNNTVVLQLSPNINFINSKINFINPKSNFIKPSIIFIS